MQRRAVCSNSRSSRAPKEAIESALEYESAPTRLCDSCSIADVAWMRQAALWPCAQRTAATDNPHRGEFVLWSSAQSESGDEHLAVTCRASLNASRSRQVQSP
eukprot:6620322-Prymnesium_polylepis.1